MANRRLIITGGAGFIGSNFARLMLAESDFSEIVILDALTYAGNLDNLAGVLDNKRIRFVKGNIADSKIVKGLFFDNPQVVNFAAETHVDRSLTSADPFIESNIIGVYVLLECARECGVEKFVHISTDEVYGPVLNGSAREDFPFKPSSPYSASKVSGEALCNAYFVSFGLPIIIARPTNNYGPYQFPEKLIPFFVKRASEGKTLPIYGDGFQERDWLHVEDCCRGIKLVLEKGTFGEAYNIGADNHRKNIDLAKKLLDILGLPASQIEHVKDRPGHDFRYAVDSTKIRSLGWSPEICFDDGFEDTVCWFKRKFGGGS